MRFLSLMSLLALGAYATAADPACINKTCPVSGKPVDISVKTKPYNPKTDGVGKASPGGATDMIGFCCPKCEATYDKDPAKYHEDLEKQKAAAK